MSYLYENEVGGVRRVYKRNREREGEQCIKKVCFEDTFSFILSNHQNILVPVISFHIAIMPVCLLLLSAKKSRSGLSWWWC